MTTDITDIDIQHINRIVFDVEDIRLCCAMIALTSGIRALNCALDMRESRVATGKFIQKNLIALCCPLLNIHLHNKTSLCVFFLKSTIAAEASECNIILIFLLCAPRIGLKIEIISANGTESHSRLLLLWRIESFRRA
jgi:hypothetical protein